MSSCTQGPSPGVWVHVSPERPRTGQHSPVCLPRSPRLERTAGLAEWTAVPRCRSVSLSASHQVGALRLGERSSCTAGNPGGSGTVPAPGNSHQEFQRSLLGLTWGGAGGQAGLL